MIDRDPQLRSKAGRGLEGCIYAGRAARVSARHAVRSCVSPVSGDAQSAVARQACRKAALGGEMSARARASVRSQPGQLFYRFRPGFRQRSRVVFT